jgi:hypothetical protein
MISKEEEENPACVELKFLVEHVELVLFDALSSISRVFKQKKRRINHGKVVGHFMLCGSDVTRFDLSV